uniref:Uncharacterized protein n=2 Tax=Glycine subgen. Soja TaxID=1462606 RepID=A0A0R0JSZ7_SOYBN
MPLLGGSSHESENNPKEDPFMLWLTGGPGCSAFSGLVIEIGPFAFKYEEYNGRLPNLHYICRLACFHGLHLCHNGVCYSTKDWILVHQVHQFLRKLKFVGQLNSIVQEISLGKRLNDKHIASKFTFDNNIYILSFVFSQLKATYCFEARMLILCVVNLWLDLWSYLYCICPVGGKDSSTIVV